MIRILTIFIIIASQISCGAQSGRDSITVARLHELSQSNHDFFLLDVRSEREYLNGHLSFTDALIPHTDISRNLDRLPPDKTAEIYCICRIGLHSASATRQLRQFGYSNVHNVEGGIIAWQKAGYAIARGK